MEIFKNKNKNQIAMIVGLFFVAALFSVISGRMKKNDREYTSIQYAMGTTIQMHLYSSDSIKCEIAKKEIGYEIAQLDQSILSWRYENSEIAKLNQNAIHSGEYEIDATFSNYIGAVLKLYENSDGALDPTLRPLIELWGIETDSPRVPSDEEIDKAMEHLLADYIHLSDDGAKLIYERDGIMLDLGSVGKGIACDEAYKILEKHNEISGATIAVGGSILVYGSKPNHQDFHIGIQDPEQKDGESLGYVIATDGDFVSTSGSYEKYFEEDGEIYHHIFDPKTGYPAKGDLVSVTVVTGNGLASDGLSTACFILGMDESKALLKQYDAEAVFVTKDHKIYVTDGLKNRFVLVEKEAYEIGK